MKKFSMLVLIVMTLVVMTLSDCTTSTEATGRNAADSVFFMPGQFDAQEAVWLGWQEYEPYYAVGADMIKALKPHVQLKIVSETDSMREVCRSYLINTGIDTTGIRFFVMPNNEFWMRDHGATFVVNKVGEMKAVDFEWNTYGYKDWLYKLFDHDSAKAEAAFAKSRASKRGVIDSLMAVSQNIPVIKSWVKVEGGAIESNGRGTLILNESLMMQRNKGVSKDSIAAEMKRVLGVRNIIWLPYGLAEDPHVWQLIADGYVGLGTGGHTDEFVRFADPHTVLLAWVPEEERYSNPVNTLNFERMSANEKVLRESVDQDGRPLRIVRVPLPPLIAKKIVLNPTGVWDSLYNVSVSAFPKSLNLTPGDSVFRVAAASYLNYHVANGVVLLPDYSMLGEEHQRIQQKVKNLFSEIYPGKELIFLNAMPLNWEGGGIHCGTQQQPKRTVEAL